MSYILFLVSRKFSR